MFFETLGFAGMLILFAIILVIIFLAALFFWGLKYALAYAINAVIGFFALYAIKAFFIQNLVINWISVALVAIGGIFGFVLVLLLHGLGLWF